MARVKLKNYLYIPYYLDIANLKWACKKVIFNVQCRKLKLPILWKWDEDDIADLPKNVMIKKWVPQQDILAHPNLKLFVTHGGLLRYHDNIIVPFFVSFLVN